MSLPNDQGWQLSKLNVPAVVARTWALPVRQAKSPESKQEQYAQYQRGLDLLGEPREVDVVPSLSCCKLRDSGELEDTHWCH